MLGKVVERITGLTENVDFLVCSDGPTCWIEYEIDGDWPTYDEVLAQMEQDSGLIEPYKQPAIDTINDVVDLLTKQMITVIFKQMGTYLSKEREAITYEDGVSDATTHPYIFAEVTGMLAAGFTQTSKGFPLTPQGMAQEYISNATLWHGLDAAIEAVRPIASELIRAGTTLDYIGQVRDTAIAAIQSLATCTTSEEIQTVLAGVSWPAKG